MRSILSKPHHQQPPNLSRARLATKPSKLNSSSGDMVGCGGNDLTPKLIFNASMEAFPGKKLSSFTTLLQNPWLFLENGRWLCWKFQGQGWFAMWLRVKLRFQKMFQAQRHHFIPAIKVFWAVDKGLSQCRGNLEKNQRWKLAHHKYNTKTQVVIYLLMTSWTGSWEVLRETAGKKFYRQTSSRIKTQKVCQQILLGKLIRRRMNFAFCRNAEKHGLEESHKTWKTFWKGPHSLTTE